jgi:hypothetical protein
VHLCLLSPFECSWDQSITTILTKNRLMIILNPYCTVIYRSELHVPTIMLLHSYKKNQSGIHITHYKQRNKVGWEKKFQLGFYCNRTSAAQKSFELKLPENAWLKSTNRKRLDCHDDGPRSIAFQDYPKHACLWSLITLGIGG